MLLKKDEDDSKQKKQSKTIEEYLNEDVNSQEYMSKLVNNFLHKKATQTHTQRPKRFLLLFNIYIANTQN
jgi:hypothetical protein